MKSSSLIFKFSLFFFKIAHHDVTLFHFISAVYHLFHNFNEAGFNSVVIL